MLKVVIADDEQNILRLLKSLIQWEKLGYEIVGMARNGYQALKLCEELRPDYLITDIRMPGLGGMELIREINRMYPQMKVIIITGYSQFQYAHQALRYGVVDYLLKPIRKEELLRALEAGKNHFAETKEETSVPDHSAYEPRSLQEIKGNILLDILRDREELRDFSTRERLLGEYHLHFSGTSFQLLEIEVILDQELNSARTRTFLENKMEEILREELGGEQVELVMAKEGGSFYCLMNADQEALERKREHLQAIRSSLLIINEMFQKIHFTIGVSRTCDSFDGIGSCVEECHEAIAHKIIAGKNRVNRYSEIPSGHYDLEFFAGESFRKEYLYAIAEGESEDLQRILQDLITKIYQYTGQLDGRLIRDLYQTLVTLFYTGIQVFGMEDTGDYSSEKLLQQFDYFYSVPAAFSYLSDRLVKILRTCREEQKSRSTRPVRMAQVYIEEHYMESIALEDVARQIGMNESYLSSIFKKQVGTSLIDYLTNVRIQHAKELLIDPERSIEDIAEEVGFHDPKYFTKRFKKYTGVSPKMYRNLFAQERFV